MKMMPVNPKTSSAKKMLKLPEPYSYEKWERLAQEGVPDQSQLLMGTISPQKLQDIFLLKKSGKPSVTSASNERDARRLYYFALADKAFGNTELALKFMTRKHPKLRATPLSKLDTEWGGRQVERLLNGMIFGLPA